MKNVIPSRTAAVRAARSRDEAHLVMNQRGLSVPVTFEATVGVLLFRDSHRTVSYWDGFHWRKLNRAGWAIKFDCSFPDDLPPNHWGIYSPIKKRRSSHHYGRSIDATDLAWALNLPEAQIAELDAVSSDDLDALFDEVDPYTRHLDRLGVVID